MYIKIDETILTLIKLLKYSFIDTHYKTKPQIIPSLEEEISIFKYTVDDDYNLHKNAWDVYVKRINKNGQIGSLKNNIQINNLKRDVEEFQKLTKETLDKIEELISKEIKIKNQ